MKLVKTLLSLLLICLVINANPVKRAESALGSTPPDLDPGKVIEKLVYYPDEDIGPGKGPVENFHFVEVKSVFNKETEFVQPFKTELDQGAILPVKPQAGPIGNIFSGVGKNTKGLQAIASKTIDDLGSFLN